MPWTMVESLLNYVLILKEESTLVSQHYYSTLFQCFFSAETTTDIIPTTFQLRRSIICQLGSHSWPGWPECDAECVPRTCHDSQRASICSSQTLLPGKTAGKPTHSLKPGIFNDPNLILAEVKAAPDTWCCVCMSALKESGEYLSLLGMPVIRNASEWCFFVLGWLELFIHLFTSRQRQCLS